MVKEEADAKAIGKVTPDAESKSSACLLIAHRGRQLFQNTCLHASWGQLRARAARARSLSLAGLGSNAVRDSFSLEGLCKQRIDTGNRKDAQSPNA